MSLPCNNRQMSFYKTKLGRANETQQEQTLAMQDLADMTDQ